jgi:uncharacterized membrane protein
LKINWRKEIIGLTLLLVMFVTSAVTWPLAPERIPIHWNFAGEIDGYGSKGFGLLILPITAVVLFAFLIFIPRIDSRRANFERFESIYRILRNTLMALMAGINVLVALSARGIAIDVGTILILLVGLSAMVIGNYLGKIRPNGIVGIRTPWTLASNESWNKTHQLGGKLFVGIGLALIIASLLGAAWAFITLGVFVGVSLVFLVIYSYLVWRTDPHKA